MSKRILHILNSSSYSGAENVAITIINNTKDFADSVYCSPKGTIDNVLSSNCIRYFALNNKCYIFELYRVIKRVKPDLIHAHDFTASVIVALLPHKIPIVSHLHNNPPWLRSINLYSVLFLISSIRLNVILGVSASVFQEFIFTKFLVKKSMVLKNTIDSRSLLMKSKSKTIHSELRYDIAFIGRLTEQKAPINFINIIYEITKLIPLKVVMIGDGDLKNDCNELIQKLNMTKTITMLGFVENPYAILSNCKILCMTSIWEGFGLVALEAMTLGKPVVAYPVGGLKDFVDNDCGFLADDKQEYINEVIKLINNREYRVLKSKNALKKSEVICDIIGYVNKINLVYSSLLK